MSTKTVERSPSRTQLISKPINRTPVNKESLEAMTRENDKMVYGTFVNIECPGQPAKISGKYYRGMDYFTQTFQDNEQLKIPLSVARFINERCFHQTHGYLLDDKGQHIKNSKPQARYKFIIESMVA